MNLKRIVLATAMVGAFGIAQAQQAETVGNAPGGEFITPVEGATVWGGPNGNVLFDNGPLVNSAGTGAGGADESVLQGSTLGMGTIGFGHQVLNGNSIIDDFDVPAPGWQIDEIVFFAYQTGSDTTSTMTGAHFQIWDGDPTVMGSSVIFGDIANNVMIDTAWSGIYRVTDTTPGATNRPIMANTAAAGTVLMPGTYWIEWQADGSLASGPWAPPITIDGVDTTGNAYQNLAGVIGPAEDGSTLTQQGFPFIIVGTPAGSVAVPTMNTVGILFLVLLVMGVAVVAVRRN
jgi:hypothetical protein